MNIGYFTVIVHGSVINSNKACEA